MSTILCDGCGQPATPDHIAERVRRLELATRYRPIHVQVLFLSDAPAVGIENDFYNAVGPGGFGNTNTRSAEHRFFEALDIHPRAENRYEECLTEFQRRGYFLTFAVECSRNLTLQTDLASDSPAQLAGSLVERLGPAVVKRIQFSYKPRFIVLLSLGTEPLIGVLQEAGLGNRLVLSSGKTIHWPLTSDPSASGVQPGVLRSLLAEMDGRAKSS